MGLSQSELCFEKLSLAAELGRRQAVGAIWPTISVIQVRDDDVWIREVEVEIEVDRFRSKLNQQESGTVKVVAQNFIFFYFPSSRKSSHRPCKRKR